MLYWAWELFSSIQVAQQSIFPLGCPLFSWNITCVSSWFFIITFFYLSLIIDFYNALFHFDIESRKVRILISLIFSWMMIIIIHFRLALELKISEKLLSSWKKQIGTWWYGTIIWCWAFLNNFSIILGCCKSSFTSWKSRITSLFYSYWGKFGTHRHWCSGNWSSCRQKACITEYCSVTTTTAACFNEQWFPQHAKQRNSEYTQYTC